MMMLVMLVMVTMLMIERVMMVVDIGDYDEAISPTQQVPHVVIQAYRQGW